MKKNKAIFLDRDGVVLKMIYDLESGYIHTALHPKQVKLVEGIIPFLKQAKKLEYKLIIASNQPNIGLKRIGKDNFERVKNKMHQVLSGKGIILDGEYYCLHHPFAELKAYRKICKCRKPKPGLLTQAAKDHNIDLKKSWMIGDGVHDVIAGHNAGCKTILIANLLESEYLHILERELKDIQPTNLIKNIKNLRGIFSETYKK